MMGWNGGFCFIQQFFIKFFTGAQAGINHTNIFSGYQSGQFDHLMRQVADFDRLTHIEYENFAAIAHNTCFQHQLHCFRNSHEIAGDLRMRNGNRTAFLNLSPETWNHRTIGIQNITKTGGYEFSFGSTDFGVNIIRPVGIDQVKDVIGQYNIRCIIQ